MGAIREFKKILCFLNVDEESVCVCFFCSSCSFLGCGRRKGRNLFSGNNKRRDFQQKKFETLLIFF